MAPRHLNSCIGVDLRTATVAIAIAYLITSLAFTVYLPIFVSNAPSNNTSNATDVTASNATVANGTATDTPAAEKPETDVTTPAPANPSGKTKRDAQSPEEKSQAEEGAGSTTTTTTTERSNATTTQASQTEVDEDQAKDRKQAAVNFTPCYEHDPLSLCVSVSFYYLWFALCAVGCLSAPLMAFGAYRPKPDLVLVSLVPYAVHVGAFVGILLVGGIHHIGQQHEAEGIWMIFGGVFSFPVLIFTNMVVESYAMKVKAGEQAEGR